jgi:hypothetical protein
VRARNIYGFGEFSEIEVIIASTHPDRPNIVTTVTDGLKVLVSFDEPPANGEPISLYTIEFYSRDGFFYQSTECDQSLVLSMQKLNCEATFTMMRQAPFFLELGDLIEVRAKATNNIGESAFSQINVEGSLIETEPAQVSGLDFDIVTSTITSIDLSWNEFTTFEETGGVPILNYKVITTANGEETEAGLPVNSPFVIPDLTPGHDYEVQVIA